MICSSVNLDRFIVRAFQDAGLYPPLAEIAEVTSTLARNIKATA